MAAWPILELLRAELFKGSFKPWYKSPRWLRGRDVKGRIPVQKHTASNSRILQLLHLRSQSLWTNSLISLSPLLSLLCAHLVLHLPHNVQIGHSWLHHEHVGSFPYVPVLRDEAWCGLCMEARWEGDRLGGAQAGLSHHRSEGQASCSRWQLVAAAVSKSWA